MRVLMVGTKKIRGAGGMATHTEELIAHLRKLGVEVEHCLTSPSREYDIVRDRLIRLYTRTLGLSLKLLKDSKKFNIVHIQASGPLGGFLPAIVGALWKKLLGFRLVVTFHYSDTENFVKKHKKLMSFVLDNTDLLIVVSHLQKKVISSEVGGEGKIVVVPNGYNPEKFTPVDKREAREKLGLPEDSKILVNVGNLLPQKGQEFLIEAVDVVVNEVGRRDVLCVIIGKGSLYEKLAGLVREKGLEGHVRLTGWVSFEDLNLYLHAADLFVLSSLHEGNPTVMFEAMGCGLPFVGTGVGGVPEIITSGDYGLIAKPADARDLAEKILMALEKGWDAEKIRDYARRFTWENVARRTCEFYRYVERFGDTDRATN
ncbi:glycosyltransferase [Geoglobus acetivorans]|uniref:Glycosyltransferase family 4 protein n=1 Tax=Geoglobus acetivorans TaxID=565033 RepID=A0ABZ3H2Y5_GEOAI|nr:glycosyltransferase family 4 protein [Geoglobus acetivorans]